MSLYKGEWLLFGFGSLSLDLVLLALSCLLASSFLPCLACSPLLCSLPCFLVLFLTVRCLIFTVCLPLFSPFSLPYFHFCCSQLSFLLAVIFCRCFQPLPSPFCSILYCCSLPFLSSFPPFCNPLSLPHFSFFFCSQLYYCFHIID